MSVARDPDARPVKARDAAGEEAWRLSRAIVATRGELDRYLEELRRRRRELTDVRLQVRRHPALVGALGVAVVAAAGGAVLMARHAGKRRAVSRVRRALAALGSLAPSPPDGRGGRLAGLLLNAGVPIGIALAKGLLRRSAPSPRTAAY